MGLIDNLDMDALTSLLEEFATQKNFRDTPIGYIDLGVYQPHKKGGKYTRDDKGLAELFSDHFMNKHRYNATRKRWMYYDGIVWKDDIDGLQAAQDLKLLQASLVVYAAQLADKDDGYYEFVSKYGSHAKRRNVLTDAQSVYPMTDEELDRDPFLFNCKDCTIDLRTTEVREHRAGDLLTKVSNVTYKIEAEKIQAAKATWEKFVSEIMEGDKSKSEYLKRVIGYSLTASTEEECFFIFYGPKTRNGKSTFAEPIKTMMGDYATTTEPATFQATKYAKEGGKASPQIAALAGMRMVLTSEAPQNMTFDEALLKTMTGGDTIYARRLNENGFNFKPQFKLIMNTNHLPRINDTTLFKGDRVRVITFDRQFTEAERDHKLKHKLSSPEALTGIFQWALEGYADYLCQGLNEPLSVKQAINKYEDDSDTIKQFVDDVLLPADNNVSGTAAYLAYRNWIQASGQQPLGKFNFFKVLKERFIMDESGYVGKVCQRNVIRNRQIDTQWIHDEPDHSFKKSSGGYQYSDR